MKKILVSLMVIILAVGLVGGGAFAYLSDVETSGQNTFTGGTFDVKIQGGGSNYQDDIGAMWTITDVKPGDNSGVRTFNFKNVGSISIDHMKITCDHTITETPNVESDTDWNNTADEFAEWFTITTLEVSEDGGNSQDLLPSLSDVNGNTRKDLYDLKHAGVDDVGTVPNPNGGSYTTVGMALRLDPNTGNDFQGDTLTVDFVFTFNQDSSQ